MSCVCTVSVMQQAGTPMLYDLARNQRLQWHYVYPLANVLGLSSRIRASSAATANSLSIPLQGQSTISLGGVLAHCRGLLTCGWTDVGDSSTRSRLWDPLPWRYNSWERLQRPVECPITLARGVGPFRFGPTRSPVLRIRAHCHPLKDGEGGPRAGLGRPGQTSRQPDAKSSATLAGPSLLRARARLKKGAGPQWGNPGRRPGAGGLIT